MTTEWYDWYVSVIDHSYEPLTLDYDACRILRLYVRSLVEEAQRERIKKAWATYHAGGELIV